ncbi:putative cystathionine gamma-lyase 2 [Halyomorpha halys]|uniref:putative cystathionine gamma-lyase 2 n=1 Tax=Halyomorpha halys TaxID=286706 RepID=UPI0006D52611|nr:putative cystathionine gamma-lyase 2 [Halyomorpha halys]
MKIDNNKLHSNEVSNVENGDDDVFHPDQSFETRAIHTGQSPDQWESGVIVPPIHTGSTYKQADPEEHSEFFYGRIGNPTRNTLETCIASLDKAKYCLTFSSGMGSIAAVAGLLKAGDHVICGDDVYGGTHSYFKNIAKDNGIEVDFIDTTVIENVENAFQPNTKMVYVESPTNPLLKIMDIPRIATAVKSESHDMLFVVDNTFLTPYLQNPLSMGADVVVYSLTKYMNGHSDVIMGAITTNKDDLYNKLATIQHIAGSIPSPFDCYLMNRSLKTLSIRMDKHIENATKVARFLEQHPLVEKVLYPGLESHPQYKLAKRLWHGPSGMISIFLKGNLETSKAFLKALKLFALAVSLGGFESLAELPTTMTHQIVPAETRKELGITDNLIRLSVGLESATDLIKDIDQALKVAANFYVPS